MAIVYIVTHPRFEGLIKIGEANVLEKRLRTLKTAAPEPYDCHYAVEVENKAIAQAVEQLLHRVFAKDRYKRSEWFKTAPQEAKRLLSRIVKVIGGEFHPLPQKAGKRKENFTFGKAGIAREATLQFMFDGKIRREITCKVAGDKKVLFDGKKISISRSAAMVLQKNFGFNPGRQVNGTLYWSYNGCVLNDMRKDK